jgi:hypothetical protein
MKLRITLLAVLVLIVSFGTASAQRQLPNGARPLTGADFDALVAKLRSGEIAESRGAKPNAAPKFVIRVTGDSLTGVTAEGRSTNLIPAGSTIVGVRIYPNLPPDYLWAIGTGYDIEPGGFWYELDNDRRAAGFERGGVVTYQILVINNGQVQACTTEKNFHNYDRLTSARHTIVDGYSINPPNGPITMYLFGNFAGPVGVVIKDADSGYEQYVPPAAITLTPSSVRIDISQVPYWYLPSGDFIVTIGDQTGYSDSFQVRLNPRLPYGAVDLSEKRLQLMQALYGK